MRLKTKGQALIEFLVAFLLLNTLLVISLGVVYLSWAKLWLTFQSTQTYLCLADGRLRETCQAMFEARVRDGLPMGRFQNLLLYRSPRARGNQYYRIKFKWRFWRWNIEHRGKLSYQSLMRKAKRDSLFPMLR